MGPGHTRSAAFRGGRGGGRAQVRIVLPAGAGGGRAGACGHSRSDGAGGPHAQGTRSDGGDLAPTSGDAGLGSGATLQPPPICFLLQEGLSPFPSCLPLLPVPRLLTLKDWGVETVSVWCVRVRVCPCVCTCVCTAPRGLVRFYRGKAWLGLTTPPVQGERLLPGPVPSHVQRGASAGLPPTGSWGVTWQVAALCQTLVTTA